ncbi:MAG: hypothetical protein J0I32_04490 [Sphingobacteriales bacterium]|nr:hypothetical protein [Sphingobacteriales bacterium]
MLSLTLATALFIHFFGKTTLSFRLEDIIGTLVNPKTIVWIVFFVLLFFGLYPLLTGILIVIYRVRSPITKKIKKELSPKVKSEMKRAGIPEMIDKIPPRKGKAFHTYIYFQLITAEGKIIDVIGSLAVILLQLAIFNSWFLNDHGGLTWMFGGIAIMLLVVLFLLLPSVFRLARKAFEKDLEEIKKTDNSNSDLLASTTA